MELQTFLALQCSRLAHVQNFGYSGKSLRSNDVGGAVTQTSNYMLRDSGVGHYQPRELSIGHRGSKCIEIESA